MHIAILEPDDATAHILSFVARRRGHKALTLTASGGLPFEPAVVIASLEALANGRSAIEELESLCDRYPESLVYVTTEERDGAVTISALRAGASDVVRKPFHPHELIMRAELHLASRNAGKLDANAVEVGDLEVDLDSYSAIKNEQRLDLTKLELRLLYCLLEHHGRVAPIERLLSFGWETSEPPDSSLLKTHVSHLRKKLQSAGGMSVEIRSRHSLGYQLEVTVTGEKLAAS